MNLVRWTGERIDTLRQLAADGLSAGKIAGELGGVTRNAVCGKLHRLGLSTAQHPVTPRPKRPKARRQTPFRLFAAIDAAPAEEMVDLLPIISPHACALLELKPESCRWPSGDPGTAGFAYCGNDAVRGFPYCVGHARLAYRPAPLRPVSTWGVR